MLRGEIFGIFLKNKNRIRAHRCSILSYTFLTLNRKPYTLYHIPYILNAKRLTLNPKP
jgi:hypothetical protein